MAGTCTFRKLTLVAAPEKSYLFKLKYKHELGFVEQGIKIYLSKCLIGEILLNSLCLKCDEKFYSLAESLEEQMTSECIRCPENAICKGGSSIVPIEGSWRLNEKTTTVIQCKYKNACPYQKDWETKNPGDPLVFTCGEGFYGNLCIQCDKGYGMMEEKGCYKCADDHLQNFIVSVKMFLVRLLMAWDGHSSVSASVCDTLSIRNM